MVFAARNIRNQLVMPLAILMAYMVTGDLYAQKVTQPSRQEAYSAYNKGDYEKAYREFTILLENYPKDPLYKYYCGTCLVMTGKEPGKASGFLKGSLDNPPEFRSVPLDAWFYLGRAQQQAGDYAEAIKSFNHLEKYAGRKIARDLNVQDFIRECSEGRGKIDDPKYGEVIGGAMGETSREDGNAGAPGRQADLSVPVAAGPGTRKTNLPASYDRTLTEALDYQVKSDSLNAIAAGYRQEYDKLPAGQKQAARARIDETEALSAKYQKLADEKFGRSDTAASSVRLAIPAGSQAEVPVRTVQDSGNRALTTKPAIANLPHQEMEQVAGTAGVFSIFGISRDTGFLKEQKIEIDPHLPSGLVYRIQIGVYSKPLGIGYFKGIIPVSGFKIPGSSSTRYFAGLFRRNADAGKALLRVRQAGFRDAFIVAASDGKQISLERASLLEKEWGLKPFFTVTASSENKQGQGEAPTLVYRVEITRGPIPVNEATAEEFSTLAGTRGLTVLMTGDGVFVYLIGKFITFDTAAEYAGLLKRNGFENARVAAYLGNVEIPVEKAKQLFEKAE